LVPCASCGYENRDDATFCGGCGAALHAERLSETPASRTPTPSPSPALPASFAAGRYEVKRFLGEGGRKRVYLAHDSKLDRDVAIAVIKTEGLDADGLTRVRREAQAMGRLGDHPHIVTVHDIGDEDPSTGSGRAEPYIVSQYMEGGDLEGLLQGAENHRLSLDQAGRIASEVRQALEHAHSHGIIHRDLKPGNIWLTRDGTAKLGDFGLAVAVDRSRLTVEGMMVGTVAYMAPEQALGRQPDARSDLYSWGCVLYEMVTGRPPFLGDDAVAIISQHINTAPVAPTWHNPEVPRALESLILRCLAKNPDERPESAAALSEALKAAMETATTVAGRAVEGEANPLDRLAGGVFVGREKEMDELRAGLEDALSGRGRLLMLVGEPGIGKTRTSEEFATYARLRSVQVLWGRCYEGEGAPAYWPWVQIIRSYVHDKEPKELMSEMGPGAADIAQVVSEVKERLPGLPVPPALEPEQARFRLFDSITTFLKNASKNQPLVLVIDDLHWADKPSLLLLQFLARELRGARLLVLGTYRDVELRRQHPLAETLGELARQQLSQRILLRGLTERDVDRFIEVTAGISPPQALVEAVYRETEGNPFFVNEIVRLLVTDGRLERSEDVKSWSVTIPQSVREVVGRRLDHLSEACNRVLTAASVIGREFGVDALERVSDISGDRLLEVMEEAVAARVVNEVPRTVGRYSFSHALIRETLYEELSTNRRVRLHRQIGEVLEALYAANPEPHLAELAHHFCEAAPGGDVEKAIGYARRAGDRALTLVAYEEAASHYQMALQAVDLKEKPDAAQRLELLLALGEAQNSAGDRDRAKETALQAADVARRLKDSEALARAALGFAASLGEYGAIDQQVVDLLDEALDALGDVDSAVRARVLSRLSLEFTFSGARQRAETPVRKAVEVARRVGDPKALADALWTSCIVFAGPDDVEERLLISAEVLGLAEKARDPKMAQWGHSLRLGAQLELGDIPAVDREIEAGARLAEELRQPQFLAWTVLFRAMRALFDGRFEEGEQLAQQTLALAQRAQDPFLIQRFPIQLFFLRTQQGRLQEMEALFRGTVEQYPAIAAWRLFLAFLYAELGREAEARTQFEQLAAKDFADLPRDFDWLSNVATLCEVCAFLRDGHRASILYDLFLPYARRNLSGGGPAICWGSAAVSLGLVAATMQRWDDAARHFEDALEMNVRMGGRPWVAHTQHNYADMLLRRDKPGDREKALALLTEALDTAQELGMKALVEKALALKLQAQGIDISSPQTSIEAVAASVYADKPDLRPHAAPDGTVTIMFSDIEGSTAMNERLGDKRWLELLREHNAIVRKQVKAHGGFEVKSAGDGFMVAFQSARKGLDCAIAIQRAFAAHYEKAEEPLKVRIGLHTGEAIKEGEDFFGKHVNLAARIAGQAQGGEILVSSLLKALVDSAGDIAWSESREVELKGLKGKHSVFQVAWE
jgi:eukaryotic-like serine/threonine-protein kinase